jgi:hypothetical protein
MIIYIIDTGDLPTIVYNHPAIRTTNIETVLQDYPTFVYIPELLEDIEDVPLVSSIWELIIAIYDRVLFHMEELPSNPIWQADYGHTGPR